MIDVTLPIRLMPPMITKATVIDSIAPTSSLGQPKNVWVTSATFQAWNILPPVNEPIIVARQYREPIRSPSLGRPSSAKARLETHMGPPLGLVGSSRLRYIIARVTSVTLSAIPKTPTTHIQNNAPGPPREIAMATPPILPRPTVDDIAVESAWKWLIAPGSLGLS